MSNSSLYRFDCVYNTTDANPLEVLERFNMHYLLRGPLLSFIIVLGLCGNFLSLKVFCNQKATLKICNYLITLEIWNSILLSGSLFLYSLPMMLTGRYVVSGQYVLVYPPLYTITNVAYVGSIWSVVLLAIERYFALCKPLRHMKWDSERRTKLLLTFSTILVVVYQMPRFFEFQLTTCYDYSTNDGVVVLDVSSLSGNTYYLLIYKIVCGLMFLSLGPFLCLTIITVIVWWRVKKTEYVRRRLSNEPLLTKRIKRRNRQMDRIMFTVIVKFCICHALPTILDVCEIALDPATFNTYIVGTFVSDTTNLLVCINSSCDFIIYYFCSQSFQFRIKRTFGIKNFVRRPSITESSDRASSF